MAENVFRANEYDRLVAYLERLGVHTVHMTNGSFARDNTEKPWQVASTTLAGFEYLMENKVPNDPAGHAFLVAVNSPESDVEHYGHDGETAPAEQERLERFFPQLEAQFEDVIPVVAAFFDKASALDIHRALVDAGINVAHEYKFFWGIGNAGPVVTHITTQAISFSYADQTVPVNAGRGLWNPVSQTTEEQRIADTWGPGANEAHENKGNVRVVNLYEIGFLTYEDKPLFPLEKGVVIPGLEEAGTIPGLKEIGNHNTPPEPSEPF